MIELSLAQAHLRLEDDEFDTPYLTMLIAAAAQNCLVYLNRAVYAEQNMVDKARAGGDVFAILLTPDIQAAMLLTLGYLYEHREDVVAGVSVQILPQNSRWLLDAYRKVPGV